MSIYTHDKIMLSPDKQTFLQYDRGAGTLNTVIAGVTIQTLDADAALIDLQALTATPAEINNAADVSARVMIATAAGAIAAGVQAVFFNSVVARALTIASATNHQGLFIVKHISSSDAQSHTVTLTSGTWNGTATVALLNAANEALAVYFDSSGNGTVLVNVGAVSLG